VSVIGSTATERVVASSDFRVVDVDGIPTRYHVDGAGQPLVLLHGGYFGFPDSLDTWSRNFASLAERFRVYALDRVGQGFTGNPRADGDYTEDFVLRHAARWLEDLGISDAHLVGHSRGGLLAARLALARPGFARSLVFISSASLAPDPEEPALQMSAFYAKLGIDDHLGPWTREQMRAEPEANSFSHAHITDGYLDRYLEISRRPEFEEVRRKMREGLAAEVYLPSLRRVRADTLRAIDERGLPCRCLCAWGVNDPSAPLKEAGMPLFERICRKTRSAEFRIFNQAGHYVYREHPREFNELLSTFCSSDARQRSPGLGRRQADGF
jgi:2-hydroxy-6-oxonona-2,4-dienedioate hydrolase